MVLEFDVVARSHDTSHRQAKQFKRVVYIAFSEYSADLKLVDDGSSDNSENSHDEDDAEMASRADRTQDRSRPDVKVCQYYLHEIQSLMTASLSRWSPLMLVSTRKIRAIRTIMMEIIFLLVSILLVVLTRGWSS